MDFRLGRRHVVVPVMGAAVLLAGMTSSTASTVPAVAPVKLTIGAPATYVMYSADEGAKAFNTSFTVPVGVTGSGGAEARNIKLTIDVSALSGTARLGNSNCKQRNQVFTCDYGSPNDGESMTPFTIRGVDGVKPGDGGPITYTASADNAPTVTATTRMQVGGPLLDLREHPPVDGVRPGGTVRITPAFANHSRYAADKGVAMKIHSSGRGLTFAREHDNCFYNSGAPGDRSDSAWCVFSTPVDPGTAYALSRPLTATAGPSVMADALVYEVSSRPARDADHTVRGKGAALTLTRVAVEGFGAQRSPNRVVEVRTTQQADYRPVTGTVTGRIGDTVRLALGVHNEGPGDPGEEPGRFEVIPPEGTTVTSIPYVSDDNGPDWVCDRPKKPSKAFVCDLETDSFGWLAPGRDTTIEFHIRIDEKVPDARGRIRAVGAFDRTHTNDTAAILVDAKPAPPRWPLTWVAAAGAAAGAVVVAGGAWLLIRRRVSSAR
ncbi:hypothetical protein ACFWU3_24430 [Streptomyces sp. NPDC058685]|uniref:hypothetical protein n=1 Tax=Streptomyces sp. NPDC058685 TaxID=3346598 RepID=UPI0036690774